MITEINSPIRLEKLLSKEEDIFTIEKFLSADEVSDVKKRLLDSFEDNPYNLTLESGIFFPYPYSTVHKNIENSMRKYFDFTKDFREKQSETIDFLVGRIEETLKTEIKPLTYRTGEKFSELNTRILYSKKNGIDIHCENAFVHQLEDDFRSWLKSKIDLLNSVSFLLTLQKSEKGGDLILFNQDWDDISISLDTTTYEERHDKEGSIFRNRGAEQITHEVVSPEEGDAIFFRAAQIWHAIDKIEGDSNRITIGCFIAKGLDGHNYYWA